MIVYKDRLLKKNSNRKLKLVLSTLVRVTTWLSNTGIAFHLLLIWLQSLVAIDSELRLTLFPSFCAQTSEVAVHAPFPRTGRFRSAALQDSIWNMLFCSYVIFVLRDEWLIEKLSNFSPILSKFSFHIMALKKNRDLLQPGKTSLRKVSYDSLWGFRFFCIFEKPWKNEATYLAVSQLPGSTIAIISAHVPGQHMWGDCGQGPEFKFSKTVQVGWSC